MRGSSVIVLNECVLDFSDYNIESTKIVINAIDDTLRGYSQFALAC